MAKKSILTVLSFFIGAAGKRIKGGANGGIYLAGKNRWEKTGGNGKYSMWYIFLGRKI